MPSGWRQDYDDAPQEKHNDYIVSAIVSMYFAERYIKGIKIALGNYVTNAISDDRHSQVHSSAYNLLRKTKSQLTKEISIK